MQGVPALSDLKLRGSYGSMGNGNIAAYTFNELFNISKSGRILNGIQPQVTGAPAGDTTLHRPPSRVIPCPLVCPAALSPWNV